jgi:hypothetical protein
MEDLSKLLDRVVKETYLEGFMVSSVLMNLLFANYSLIFL